jgi:hypothetical protein
MYSRIVKNCPNAASFQDFAKLIVTLEGLLHGKATGKGAMLHPISRKLLTKPESAGLPVQNTVSALQPNLFFENKKWF